MCESGGRIRARETVVAQKFEPQEFAAAAMQLPTLHFAAAKHQIPQLQRAGGGSYTLVTGGVGPAGARSPLAPAPKISIHLQQQQQPAHTGTREDEKGGTSTMHGPGPCGIAPAGLQARSLSGFMLPFFWQPRNGDAKNCT